MNRDDFMNMHSSILDRTLTGNGMETINDYKKSIKRSEEQTQILKELVKRDREREQREVERVNKDNERHKRLLESEQKAMEMSNINIKISTRTFWATIILGITSIILGIVALFK